LIQPRLLLDELRSDFEELMPEALDLLLQLIDGTLARLSSSS